MRKAAVDPGTAEVLEGPELRDTKGRAFWQELCRRPEPFDSSVYKLVSLAGADEKADGDLLRSRKIDLMPENCSFTGPRAGELPELVKFTRCVLVTFNSRNWNNYPEKGVIVIWSDQEKAEWLEFDDAADDWGITAEEWADPAGKLFGKKAPFQHTYD